MNAVNEGSVGLLVVHGVGRQKEGESSAKLIEGLSRMDGVEIGTSEDVLRIDGTDVRVFEVYWADLLTGAEIERTFDSRDLQTVAWFPWFNRVRGIYKDGDYRWGTTLLWTFFLPIASFLSWLGLQGAGLLVKLGEAFVRVAREIGAVFDRGRGQSSEPERIKDTKRETKALSWKGALQTAQEAKDEYTTVDSLMDDYAGDVFTYVDSAGEAFKKDKPIPGNLRLVFGKIVGRFNKQLLAAHKKCGRIQILAHSLGTVVSYHGLFGMKGRYLDGDEGPELEEARAKVEHLYTLGSPLEKFRFFWPRLIQPTTSLGDGCRWDNFVSRFDPIAGTLRRFGEVENHYLLGGGFITGHIVYERNEKFLKQLSRGLTNDDSLDLRIERTQGEALKDVSMLVGESIAAPVALAVSIGIGTGLIMVTAMAVPFLASKVIALLGNAQLAQEVSEKGGLGFIVMFVAVMFCLGPLSKGSTVHKQNRLSGKPSNGSTQT